jgi:Leucine rich repeat/Leucine Rich repeat
MMAAILAGLLSALIVDGASFTTKDTMDTKATRTCCLVSFVPFVVSEASNIDFVTHAEPQSDAAGLVASIEAQGGDVVRDQNGHIVDISLARTWATDADIERIAGVKSLKRLDLSLTYISDRGVERLKGLDQLEELNLFAAEFVTDAALAFLRGNRQLTTLSLRGTDVTDSGLAYVAELSRLKSLDISFTQITDVGLEHLASLAQLEELNLGGDKISGVGLHVLKLLPKLRKLSFYGIQRRNAGWCWAPVMTDLELETISLLSGLEDLNVGFGVALGAPRPPDLGPADGEAECRIAGGTRLTDLGLLKLAKLKRLRQLDLSGSAITASGLKALVDLPELRRLSLWNVKGIDDAAAPYLGALGNLTSLDLSNTDIGDGTLARLATLSNLKRLYVSETKVTQEGLTAFQQQRPASVVSWGTRPAPRVPLSPGRQHER